MYLEQDQVKKKTLTRFLFDELSVFSNKIVREICGVVAISGVVGIHYEDCIARDGAMSDMTKTLWKN